MIRAFPYPGVVYPERAGRGAVSSRMTRPLTILVLALTAALAAVLVALAAFMATTFLLLAQAPPGVEVGALDGARGLPLETAIQVKPEGWAARVESAALWETQVLPNGTAATTDTPLQVSLLSEGWMPGQTEMVLQPAAGALRPDSTYRLMLRGSALAAALPWPRTATFEREVRFDTPPSPKPLPIAGVTQLKWEAPLPIQWSLPIERFDYEVTPTATSRAWIGGADRRLSYVVIENPREATSYQINVTQAVAENGIRLQQPATYTVVTPQRPIPVGTEKPLVAEIEKPLALRWNVPIEQIEYDISPQVSGTWQLDGRDPTVTLLQLEGLKQGSRYELKILRAIGQSGAPLAAPQTLAMETPPALKIAEFQTGSSSSRVPIGVRPVIVFSEPVRDRRSAERAISVSPSIQGRFEWIDDQRVRFVAPYGFPYDTRIAFTIQPGLEAARGASGGFLEEGAVLPFRTVPNKTIDVDVSRQVLTLIEAQQAVRTFSVATGLPGADTPLGEFRVQYKMPTARFRGTNTATGGSYDLQDVKWVLAFMGDYTIHGAYWRQDFGRPGSNGCVSLTDVNAKIVYDWAPEGTLIRIHY